MEPLNLSQFKLPAGSTPAATTSNNPMVPPLDISKFKLGYTMTSKPSDTMTPQPGLFQGALQSIAKPFLSAARAPLGVIQEGIGKLTGSAADVSRGKALAGNQPFDFGPLGTAPQLGYDAQGNKLSTAGEVKQGIGTGAQIGSYFAPAGGFFEEGVGWLSRIAKSAIAGAANLGGAEAAKPDSTAGSIAGQTAIGAVTGPALEAAGEGVFKGISKVISAAKDVINPDVESAFTRAIKPGKNNTGWASDIKSALPEIADTLKEKGVDVANMSMDDLKGAIVDTKKKVWDLFEKKLSPNSHVTVDTQSIADSIESGITKRMQSLTPEVADRITTLASKYRNMGQISLGDAEEFLQEANSELQTYYAKNKVGQKVAQTDSAISSTLKEADGLRTALYSKLDELTGNGASQIKKLYGSLSNVANEVEGRAAVVARQAPASLQETIHTPLAVAKGAASILRGDIIGAGEAATQIGMSQAMKAANSTEGLIRKAFGKILSL